MIQAVNPNTPIPPAVKKAATDFEAVFATQLLGFMFEGVETDGPFGGGTAEETFRSLLFNEQGKMIAKSGTLGLADSLQRAMLQLQEAKNANQS